MQAKFMLKLKVSTESTGMTWQVHHKIHSQIFFSVILCNSTPSETKSTRLNSLLNENIEKSEPYGKSSWLSETCSHCQL